MTLPSVSLLQRLLMLNEVQNLIGLGLLSISGCERFFTCPHFNEDSISLVGIFSCLSDLEALVSNIRAIKDEHLTVLLPSSCASSTTLYVPSGFLRTVVYSL